ncbi:MAG: bile acid:sodium symporter family protein [Nanobdellota archaeon]
MVVDVADVLVKVVLFLIMFGVGLSVRFRDFKKLFIIPKEVIIGTILQIVALPLLAFIVAELSGLSDPLKAGLVILSACPGGTTSNFISFLTNAKTSLSIALTSVNSIIILFSIPTITTITLTHYMGSTLGVSIPFGETMFIIFVIVLLPAIIGMLVSEWNQSLFNSLKKPIKIVSVILFVIFFIIKFFGGDSFGGTTIDIPTILSLLIPLFVFHLLALAVGFFGGRLFHLEHKARVTLGIEVGLQNTALALLITSTVLSQELLSYPALTYALFSFWTTLLFAFLTRKLFKYQESKREHGS